MYQKGGFKLLAKAGPRIAKKLAQLSGPGALKAINKSGDHALDGPRGLVFVGENLGKPTSQAMQRARDFESGTSGAFSLLSTKQRVVPGLVYNNDNINGKAFVKFDGFRILDNGVTELIDAKTRIVPFSTKAGPFISPSVQDSLGRQSRALAQNPGFRGVIEVPTVEVLREARLVLRELGITNIHIRVRGTR